MMKHHCVCPDEDVIVVYDGVKTFWKTRGCLDITIVLHSELLCYEVITYDSFVGLEAPRIYLSSLLVAEKINSTDVETAVAEKKEALIRNKTSFVPEEVTKSIQHEMMIQYILSRLSIPNDLPSGSVAVVLLPFSTDKIDDETKLLDVICEKPSNLISLEIQGRQKNSTSKEIHELLHNVKAETTALQYSTHLAELMTSSVDGFQLMLRERIQLKCRVSAVQWRWIKAINKVITQNAVAKIKLRLAEIERAHSKKKIFRMPKKVESKDGNSGHGGIPKSPHYMSGLRNEHSPHSSGHSLTRSCNSSPLSTPLTSPHSSPATTPRSIGDSSISSHRRSQHLSIIAERRKLREVAGETGRRLSRSCASSPVQHLHSQSRPSTPSSPVGNDAVGSPTKKSSSSATLLIKSLTNNGLPAIGDCD